ncbi:LPS export ABC transporter periplasmic protein LptC [Rufibacter sp. LB8]|nr:LPS export ABC transporter periplasmic protein LptC [Rufibacter sp. LB8]
MRLFLSFAMACAAMAVGCQEAEKEVKIIEYKGPASETVNVETIYSDSAKTKLKMNAPLQQDMQNGDILYPKGMFITFYENGQPTTTVTAKYGKYNKKDDQYFVKNDVVVKNTVKNEQLNTEELYWNRQRRQIFTDKFVRITSAEEVVTGHGLTSNEDFSNYKLTNFSGSFRIKQ